MNVILAALDSSEELAVETLLIGLLVTAVIAAFAWFVLSRVQPSWAGPVTAGIAGIGALITLLNVL